MKIENLLENFVLYLASFILLIALFQEINCTEIAIIVVNVWQWFQVTFSPIWISYYWQSSLLPAAFSILLALFFQFLLPGLSSPSSHIWQLSLLATFSLFAGLRYMGWRLFATLNLTNIFTGTLTLIFFSAELVNFTNDVILLFQSIFWPYGFRNRSAQADKLSEAIAQDIYQPWVDVFVPTYNESVDILRRTIIGCQAMDYENKRVYLLDDNRRPKMEELAKELECIYRKRPDNEGKKAGNLNYTLADTEGELIAVFDADFVPTKNFLNRVVVFFYQQPGIALVQTPKHFYNEEAIKFNLGIPQSLTSEEDVFYKYILPSRDATNSIMCHGTSYVVRRDVVKEIGGFPTEAAVEDIYLSIKLQSAGYKLIYLNENLSAGAAPESIDAFVGQRLRWGKAVLQGLFCPTINPLTLPRMTFMQRLHSLSCIIYWFSAASRTVFLLMPIFYILIGWRAFRTTVVSILSYWLPYYLFSVLTTDCLNGGTRSRSWSEVYQALICFPLALTIVQTIIKPFGKSFHVTPKGLSLTGIKVNWQVANPLIITAILCLIAIFMGLTVTAVDTYTPGELFINLTWAVYNFFLLIVSIQAAIDIPQERQYLRFSHYLDCELRLGEEEIPSKTINLSEGGSLLEFHRSFLPALVDEVGSLSIPEIGLVEVPVRVVRQEQKQETVELSIEFAQLSVSQQRQLIEFLFCRPGQWETERVSEMRSLWAFFLSIFRLYPLTETR
ncbi:MAG: glycosyltransferase [Xenococcaceae cyanobacterium]